MGALLGDVLLQIIENGFSCRQPNLCGRTMYQRLLPRDELRQRIRRHSQQRDRNRVWQNAGEFGNEFAMATLDESVDQLVAQRLYRRDSSIHRGWREQRHQHFSIMLVVGAISFDRQQQPVRIHHCGIGAAFAGERLPIGEAFLNQCVLREYPCRATV